MLAKIAAFIVLISLAGLTDHASATVIVTATVDGTAQAGSTLVNFDNLPSGSNTATTNGMTLSFSNTTGGIVSGNSSGYYAEPWQTANQSAQFDPSLPAVTGSDTTQYVSTGIGSAILSFTLPERYFALLWGSVDTYNSLSFYNAQGGLISSVTSAQFLSNADGNQSSAGSYFVAVSTDQAFTKVIASSSQYAFEFDDVAFSPGPTLVVTNASPVVEASSIAIMVGALAGMMLLRRRGFSNRSNLIFMN